VAELDAAALDAFEAPLPDADLPLVSVDIGEPRLEDFAPLPGDVPWPTLETTADPEPPPVVANIRYTVDITGLAPLGLDDEFRALSSLWTRKGADANLAQINRRVSEDKQLIDQFPQSRYAADSRLRMNHILHTLAAHEVHVARYYFRRGAYLAAVNRAQVAVTEYQQAPAAEEALFILMQSYEKLQMTSLRDATERVLKQNFPNSDFLSQGFVAREKGKAWWKLW
jgi:outer membrane protein assembly factor BamD